MIATATKLPSSSPGIPTSMPLQGVIGAMKRDVRQPEVIHTLVLILTGDRRSRRSYSSASSSRSPPRRERRKSVIGEAVAALGLGGLAGGFMGRKGSRSSSRSSRDDRRSGRSTRSRSRRRRAQSVSDPRSRSRGGDERRKVTQALKAAALAGVGEAFRARNEPGGWGGEKGKRILTAAITAGGVDGLIDRDPNKHSKRHVVEAAIAGLATNRIVNGPRSRSRSRGRQGSPDGRGRSRSQSRGLKDIVAGGALGAGAKGLYDRMRSKSRGRGRSRSLSSSSSSSYDSRSPPRGQQGRRKSISDYANAGLAKLGINDSRGRGDGRDDRYEDEYNSGNVGQPFSGAHNGSSGRSTSRPRAGNYALDFGPHHNGDPDTDSNSDLGSSSDEEQERKKASRKNYVTGALATVATIHAGHSIYQSYEKRKVRREKVEEGEISPEQAKKERNKNRLQDAASIGIAALGIKGAVSEWKEMKEQREQTKELREKLERHRAKREARRAKADRVAEMMSDPRYASSMPNVVAHTWPYYSDGNPYNSSAALPPPPGPPMATGPATRRYDPRWQ